MTFLEAVQATPSVRTQYRAGLQALPGGHAARIRCGNPRRFTGSLNVDAALQIAQPHAQRWDYGIGLRRSGSDVAIWVEVHPASSSGVSDMLAKLRWLRDWLRNEATALQDLLPEPSEYYWVSTDASIAITPNSMQAKRLAAAGLRGPTRVLTLA
jgi:hypothetical protein